MFERFRSLCLIMILLNFSIVCLIFACFLRSLKYKNDCEYKFMICGCRKLRDTNEVRCTCHLFRDGKFHFQSRNESGKWTYFLMTLCLYVTDKLRAYPQHKVLQRANYFRRKAIFLKFTDANLLSCRRIITILKLDNLCNKFLVSCL